MTSKQFNNMAHTFLSEIICRLKTKGEEYGSTENRLSHNYRLAGLTGLNPKEATFYEMAKHIVSLLDLCKNNGDIKKWDEKLGDIIAYAVIIRALKIDEESGENND